MRFKMSKFKMMVVITEFDTCFKEFCAFFIENIDAIADKSGKFEIVKTFPSTYEMNTYEGDDVQNGDFVMISSSDRNNGKTYMKTDGGYVYINNFADFSSLPCPVSYILW